MPRKLELTSALVPVGWIVSVVVQLLAKRENNFSALLKDDSKLSSRKTFGTNLKKRNKPMVYFYYQKTFSGKWTPKKSTSKPEPKHADGSRVNPISQVTELDGDEEFYTLNTLVNLFPLEQGELSHANH
jgi:hypothetical protein